MSDKKPLKSRQNTRLASGRGFIGGAALCCLVLLAGCGQISISLQGAWPVSAVQPLPVRIGVLYDSSIANYSHEEAPPIGRAWVIDLKDTQQRLLHRTFTAMFSQVHTMGSLDEASRDAPLAGILLPILLDFQLATPAQTHKNYFEVWLKYEIQLLAPDSSLLHRWHITAYGQAPKITLQGQGQSMRIAVSRALRDANAAFVAGFPALPAVKKWLAQAKKINT